ncbi:ABC transporter ATP-binding protein [Haladaptatus sp. ZSTT2]|uniref:ABC transporter ATP-binding protein n=1 Tax=Haladaptatus sp. ZSTT2 TaxID=3120515 RepID=UPI00300E8314
MVLAIETDNLRKSYGDVDALQGLDLAVEEGEFFGLLGPNGAGKTTFISILTGLVRKSGGEASVFGYDVEADYQQARDAIGVAPQEFNVDRFFPIKEVLMHKAGYHGIGTEEASRRADAALKKVGIYDKRDTRFDWLSGGMKRRLLLARAIVTEPDLLILDEPTAGVDVQLRRDLWNIITEMNEEGTTILLTTHYIEEAERLCDRVAIMNEGKKVTVASPDDLMDQGVDNITITLRDPPKTAPDVAVEGVESVELKQGRVVVRAHRAGSVAPDVLLALDDAGHEVVDLDISRTSLEEVFVSLTNGRESTNGDRPPAGAKQEAPR